jgi:hypothetical protein
MTRLDKIRPRAAHPLRTGFQRQRADASAIANHRRLRLNNPVCRGAFVSCAIICADNPSLTIHKLGANDARRKRQTLHRRVNRPGVSRGGELVSQCAGHEPLVLLQPGLLRTPLFSRE